MSATDDGLTRLEVLREFKRRMPRTNPDINVSPFDDRISTAASGSVTADVADLHAAVRNHIQETILAVRDGRKQSQVILLSGAAGVGKTHLLRTFQRPERMQQLDAVFVGGSNHWQIDEFPARLLDWILESLTAPSPSEQHLLLERIEAIGFRALEHLLSNPVSWKLCLARPQSWPKRLLPRWFRPSHEKLTVLIQARNPKVFRYFDFASFSQYVCDRFLSDRSNVLQRYTMRVLLTYLFPDPVETGIGTRERVLHWFRGRSDDSYFVKRLGSSERPDRVYSQLEAVKLLAHLFSPHVSTQLSTESVPCRPRVLLLTFDQAEGRDELFDKDDDWRTFFAHLSELYNTLPNVVVLFTMTLGLKNRLHATMERQFRDRIRMDEKFTLSLPSQDQMRELYRARIDRWLNNDSELQQRYAGLLNPYIPFTPEEVITIGANQAVRDTLLVWDEAFRDRLRKLSVDAALDYLYERNELKKVEANTNEWEYTSKHLETVESLWQIVGAQMAREYQLDVREVKSETIANLTILRWTFYIPNQSGSVTIYLARLGKNYTNPILSLINSCLYNREKAKNFLWLVRPTSLPLVTELVDDRYASQIVTGVCGIGVESTFLALKTLAGKYCSKNESPSIRTDCWELVINELGRTYFVEMLKFAKSKLPALGSLATSESGGTHASG